MSPFILIVPAFAIIVFSEFALSRKRKDGTYDGKDLIANFFIGIGGLILGVVSKKALEIGLFFFVFQLFTPLRLEWLGYESLGWAWWVWILAILGDDFTFYWHHRWSHKIRILWAAHVVHHSSRYFNFSIGLRNGWAVMLYKHFWWLWMPALGFEPGMITLALIFNALYQFLQHTQHVRSYGLPASIFVTPGLHEIHHASNIRYLDKNYGGILIIWDRIFGTYQRYEPEVEKVEFGVLNDPASNNPFFLHVHEFLRIFRDLRRSKTLKEVFFQLFGQPGWSSDGSTKTANELQREFLLKTQHDG